MPTPWFRCVSEAACWTGVPRLQVVLCGKGKHFCAGIDFAALEGVTRVMDAKCPGRAREQLFRDILRWQVQAPSPCAL